MLARKLTSLIRASGCFARGMVTSRTPLAYSVPPPSILASVCCTPVLTDPSLIKPYPKINILDLPFPLGKIIDEKPTNIIPLEDQISGNVIEDPTKVIEQRAARLVVIRRKKMKKHKRKKLKKKMKFVWLKVRQRREMRKEKAFQAELMSKISEAENFNAMMYAKEKIDKANTVLLPRYWKGKRLPDFVIREELEKKQLKQKLRNEKIERRKSISTKVSDYVV